MQYFKPEQPVSMKIDNLFSYAFIVFSLLYTFKAFAHFLVNYSVSLVEHPGNENLLAITKVIGEYLCSAIHFVGFANWAFCWIRRLSPHLGALGKRVKYDTLTNPTTDSLIALIRSSISFILSAFLSYVYLSLSPEFTLYALEKNHLIPCLISFQYVLFYYS